MFGATPAFVIRRIRVRGVARVESLQTQQKERKKERKKKSKARRGHFQVVRGCRVRRVHHEGALWTLHGNSGNEASCSDESTSAFGRTSMWETHEHDSHRNTHRTKRFVTTLGKACRQMWTPDWSQTCAMWWLFVLGKGPLRRNLKGNTYLNRLNPLLRGKAQVSHVSVADSHLAAPSHTWFSR